MIAKGSKVQIRYALFLEDGTQVDGNADGEPLGIVVGEEQMMPALEEAMIGMAEGESKKIVLTPEQAYGPVREEGFQEVPLEDIPAEGRNVGSMLTAENDAGDRINLRVHEIGEDKIVLDLNHPLAGQTLTFDIEILSVE